MKKEARGLRFWSLKGKFGGVWEGASVGLLVRALDGKCGGDCVGSCWRKRCWDLRRQICCCVGGCELGAWGGGCVGFFDGAWEGALVVSEDRLLEGKFVGLSVGVWDGKFVGSSDGSCDGTFVGEIVGVWDESFVVGLREGKFVIELWDIWMVN